MRDAEQAGQLTGWSRNATCETGSRRRRGAGWTPDPVAAQSDPFLVELDPAEVADHLTALLAVGWTLPTLEQETGLDQEQLRRLQAGIVVDPRSAVVMVDFGVGWRPGQQLAPSLGPWRRTQALTAMGWSLERQAAELSISPRALDELRHTRLIDGRLWQAIDGLYDRWSMTPGPDTTVMAQSRAAGVTPPLGWDEEDLDHPSARSLAAARSRRAIIDEAVIERRCGGDTSVVICPGERAEITRIAVDERWPAARLALVLDIDVESARRTLRRWRAADREVPADQPATGVLGDDQAEESVASDHEVQDALAGPTEAEMEALGRESDAERDWTDPWGLGSEGMSRQLDLGLALVPWCGEWRRPSPSPAAGAAGGGGGDPGEYEQLALEVVVAQVPAA